MLNASDVQASEATDTSTRPERTTHGPTTSGRSLDRLLLFGPFAVLTVLTFDRTSDDPLITLRYAANLAHGHGPVFNVGQRIEGFTSPLHLLLMSAIYLIPGGLKLLEAKLLSLLFAVLSLVVAGQLNRRTSLPPWAHRLALFLTGSSLFVVAGASNALETSLATFLITALLIRLVSGDAFEHPLRASVLAGLCTLTRPEAVLVVLAAGVAAALIRSDVVIRKRIAWAVGGLAIFAVSTGGRLVYFGDALPNTYYAKAIPVGSALRGGVRYIVTSMQPGASQAGDAASALGTVLGLCVVVLVTLTGAREIVRQRRELVFPLAAVAAQTAFVIRSGGDWMGGGRFLAPVGPAIVIVEVVGAVAIVKSLGHLAHARHIAVGLLAAASLLPFLYRAAPIWRTGARLDDRSLVTHGGYEPFSRIWAGAPDILVCARPGDLVAFSEVGFVGYSRLDLRILDTHGLTDRGIAKSSPTRLRTLTGVTDPNWMSPGSPVGRVLTQQAPAFILSLDGPFTSAVLDGRYALVGVRPYAQNYSLALYRRADRTCTSSV